MMFQIPFPPPPDVPIDPPGPAFEVFVCILFCVRVVQYHRDVFTEAMAGENRCVAIWAVVGREREGADSRRLRTRTKRKAITHATVIEYFLNCGLVQLTLNWKGA